MKLSGHLLSYNGQGMLAEPYGEAEIEIEEKELLEQLKTQVKRRKE